jgi:hypothetical protein
VTIKLRYITDRGGSTTQGLSLYLSTLVDNYQALAIDSELRRVSLDEQVNIVTEFCKPATHLIANSYGAYLWLLSRIDAAPSDTPVLLLSPVMGRAIGPEKMLSSRPHRLRGFESAIAEGHMVTPKQVLVVTGRDDDVCTYQTAVAQCAKPGIDDLIFVNREGHNLSHAIVERAVHNFVNPNGKSTC